MPGFLIFYLILIHLLPWGLFAASYGDIVRAHEHKKRILINKRENVLIYFIGSDLKCKNKPERSTAQTIQVHFLKNKSILSLVYEYWGKSLCRITFVFIEIKLIKNAPIKIGALLLEPLLNLICLTLLTATHTVTTV